MGFFPVPSLEHMALVKIALPMLYGKSRDKDIQEIIEEVFYLPGQIRCYDRERHKLWKRIEKKAVEKVSFLPQSLQTKLSKCIRPLHMETCRWIQDHCDLLKLGCLTCHRACKNLLSWNSNGTINRTKTAKTIASKSFLAYRDPTILPLKASTRFEIACIYFLPDVTRYIWLKKMRKNIKSHNHTKVAVEFWIKRWAQSKKKQVFKKLFDKYFEEPHFCCSNSKLRLSCLFPHLSWKGKKSYFPYFDTEFSHDDDLQSCIGTMSEEERMELFQTYPENILYIFLKWPFQYLFMEKANELCIHMRAKQFLSVLDRIVFQYILEGIDDYDYLGLLKEFWCLIPDSFKDQIKMKEDFGVIDVALNYPQENEKLSLQETLENHMSS